MHVISTAGHVDHGKSTLVRALTGMEPDRWAAERERGLSIGLGYVWATIGGQQIAFVDVPGHAKFVPTMLAGAGPAPAVVFVVAADAGWMPQSEEHLAVLDAFGVRHGLLVVTRSDLADPGPARTQALERMATTSLGPVPAVAVSAVTGAGLEDLRAALVELTGCLPRADHTADVRLWVDRVFTVDGSGTVATGTLQAGTITVGDRLAVAGREVTVRGVRGLGKAVESAAALARVAVNLRGLSRQDLTAGQALCTPGCFVDRDRVDVVLGRPAADLPERAVAHIGAAAVPVHVRPLGPRSARLRLAWPLPLRVGDRLVVREPGRADRIAGAELVDVDPPDLRLRGSAARRGAAVEAARGPAERLALALAGRGFAHADQLRVAGLAPTGESLAAGWYADPGRVDAVVADLRDAVRTAAAEDPLCTGVSAAALADRLDVPDLALMPALAEAAGLAVTGGAVRVPGADALPPELAAAVQTLLTDLSDRPFQAPDAARLAELGLGPRELAAATAAGRLERIAEGIVLAPGAVAAARERLAGLPAPFTPSQARAALESTRRLVVPLLELFDARGWTRRDAAGARTLTGGAGS